MTLHTLLQFSVCIAFFLVVVLWAFGADRVLGQIGRFAVRLITFNRVKIPDHRLDHTAEMVVGFATLVGSFIAFLVLSSFLH